MCLLILVIGVFEFVSKHFIDGMCAVALAPATMTVRGATFHPTYTLKSLHDKYMLNLRMSTSVTSCFHVDDGSTANKLESL